MNGNQPRYAREMGGVTFHHPGAFWFGAVAIIVGVILHLPMYVCASEMGYRMVGMPMDAPMMTGMSLIVVGLVAAFHGLCPPSTTTAKAGSPVTVRTLDAAPICAAHVGLLLVMAIAVTIDVMKPTTIAFVMPGMALEYGLRSPLNPTGETPVAYLPLFAIIGMVSGSFLWGWLGDRMGRRAAILFAGITFIATSICGAMPDYRWNFFMCFVMGMGVGGMLPICYVLLAETIPAKHRGWLMVLIGGDIAAAYILTSWLAAELTPIYSWRILWLLGLPTGVMLIFLNRWIPESPRYLFSSGREAEARAVMARFGATIVEAPPEQQAESAADRGWSGLFAGPLRGQSLAIMLLAIGAGLVLFGFNLWIPSNLRKLGLDDITADKLLRDAALIGFPFTFVVAWMYGFWSSKKTIVLLTSATALSLFGLAAVGEAIVANDFLLHALLVAPIWGISTVTAALSVYSSEIFPTRIRSRGTGLTAAASKAGGVLIVFLVAFGAAAPSISGTALIGAIPMALAALAILIFGVETRNRQLEEITGEALRPANAAPFV